MLVHHADSERLRVARVADGDLLAVQQKAPPVGRIKPHMHLTSVDLPAPFSPSSAWKDPAGAFRETSCSALSAPNDFDMPVVLSDGAR